MSLPSVFVFLVFRLFFLRLSKIVSTSFTTKSISKFLPSERCYVIALHKVHILLKSLSIINTQNTVRLGIVLIILGLQVTDADANAP